MELKPCPFCGGEDIKVSSFSGEAVVWCENCSSRTVGYEQPEKFVPAENGLYRKIEAICAGKNAIDKWNRRREKMGWPMGIIDEAIKTGELPPDAVEVVRCKDCIYIDSETNIPGFVYCNFHDSTKDFDGYCDEGERRDDVAER